jgi:hypothetical protein
MGELGESVFGDSSPIKLVSGVVNVGRRGEGVLNGGKINEVPRLSGVDADADSKIQLACDGKH